MMEGDVAGGWRRVPFIGNMMASLLGKVSESWMPAVTGLHFLPLFLLAVNSGGLNAATTYTYGVQALDAAGNVSPQSNAASATTQPTPDTTPPLICIYGTVVRSALWGKPKEGKEAGKDEDEIIILTDKVEKPRKRFFDEGY